MMKTTTRRRWIHGMLPLMLSLFMALSACASTGDKPFETLITAPGDDHAVTSVPETEPVDTLQSRAEALCAEMTLDEKIGQLFLVRADGSEKTALADIETYHVGGYVLFASDFADRTPDNVKRLTDSFQSASKTPMFIAVDEEGGTVTRISRYKQYRSEKFMSPRELLAEGGIDLVTSDTAEKCALLASLGINLNLAPVADVSVRPNEFMFYRSAGDADSASRYVRAVIETSDGTGVGAVLKHFPGYGNNVDTHTGIATDYRSLESFRSTDFLPFLEGINAGASAVMVSHNIVVCLDANRPASLSPEVVSILRGDEFNFDGVILTDDLTMDAISDQYGAGEAAVLALEAGNDIICSSDLVVKYQAVRDAVASGRITSERIDESVMRILIYKISLGILA